MLLKCWTNVADVGPAFKQHSEHVWWYLTGMGNKLLVVHTKMAAGKMAAGYYCAITLWSRDIVTGHLNLYDR